MNILFVCSANQLRSPTAEHYFSVVYPEHNFQSAGTNPKICLQEGTTLVDEEMLEWADKIFVMEPKHEIALRKYSDGSHMKKVKILNIPDIYDFDEKDLIDILIDKTSGEF